jgi:hypothetical protein
MGVVVALKSENLAALIIAIDRESSAEIGVVLSLDHAVES